MEEFKKKYRRDCDILLIDDLQFLQGKSTHKEFGYTINALIESGKAKGKIASEGFRSDGIPRAWRNAPPPSACVPNAAASRD